MKRGRDLFKEQSICFFLTLTISGFIEIFRSEKYRQLIIESLKFCQKEFNLKLLAYVIMPNHLHLLVWLENGAVSKIINSFKQYTSKRIIKGLKADDKIKILSIFKREVKKYHKGKPRGYQVWQDRFDDVVIYSFKQYLIKMNYIHYNPVKAGLVKQPEDYKYSSARNYLLDDHSVIKVDTDWNFI